MKQEFTQIKHARSAKDFPEIDLRDDEYVVLALKRSDVGIAMIWAAVAGCIVLLSIMVVLASGAASSTQSLFALNDTAKHYLWMGIIVFYLLIVAIGFMGQSIYKSNRLYVTNKRAIQLIRNSLFNNSTQVIELGKIEDVSFRQNGIFDHIFHIGVLRMSTVGEETTYTFPMLDTPHDEVETISKLVYDVHNPKVVEEVVKEHEAVAESE